MSHRLISRSPDLQQLRDEGYAVEVKGGYLLVHDVPYLAPDRSVRRGTLVSTLDLANDVTVRPTTHVVHFTGEHPCNLDGTHIAQIAHASRTCELMPGLVVQHSFSNKPRSGYANYHEKMTRYIEIVANPARAVEPDVSAQTFRVIAAEDEESPFEYIDTATSRAGIGTYTAKLEGHRVAVVGLGGTGSYVLDLVAKTPVFEIHVYDGDSFCQHNAFRSPGAVGVQDLKDQPKKAAFFAQQYGRMKRRISAHPYYIDAGNVGELRVMDFVFVCVDSGDARRLVVENLMAFGVPFADVGMGVFKADAGLGGVVRVTSSTPRRQDHVLGGQRIPFGEGDGNNEYNRNIQIAELNALNAALAVIRWKKHLGYYLDLESEHHTTYTIDGNMLTNEDRV